MVLKCVIDFVAKRLVDRTDGLSDVSKSVLKETGDSVTILSSLTVPAKIIGKNDNAPTDDKVQTKEIDLGWKKKGNGFESWKKVRVKRVSYKVSKNFTIELLGEDDLFTKYTCSQKIATDFIRSRRFLPLDDTMIKFESDEQATALLEELKLGEGQANPLSYNTDFNMKTDESFSRIFFYSMGAVLLAAQEEVSESEFGPFIADMPLQALKTRDHYRRYGARVHFSEDQRVTAIYDYEEMKLVKPGENGWEEAKMLAKVTAFTLITAREHLTWTHFLMSNTVTAVSTLCLPPSHPIRRLLTIFTFNSTEVNLNAYETLVKNGSLLHRTSGFVYPSLKGVFDFSYTTCNIYEPFSDREYNPALQKLSDDGKFPYISEGVAYFDIVRGFVREWLGNAGSAISDSHAMEFYEAVKESTQGQKYELPAFGEDDAMVNLLSQAIFTVTAYHELVGSVVDFTILPSRAGEQQSTLNVNCAFSPSASASSYIIPFFPFCPQVSGFPRRGTKLRLMFNPL
jgi:hypothetical protein